MKYSDLKHGETYRLERESDGYFWLLRFDKVEDETLCNLGRCICSNGDSYNSPNHSTAYEEGHEYNYDVREASYEEKLWLQACEEQGRFVPLEKVKITEQYEIY